MLESFESKVISFCDSYQCACIYIVRMHKIKLKYVPHTTMYNFFDFAIFLFFSEVEQIGNEMGPSLKYFYIILFINT